MGVFAMPSLGADMEAGTLTEWLVKPGDRVARGDIVAVVETQKGAIEIEIFEEGTVSELTAEIGQKLPVGAPLAVVLGEGEAAPQAAPPSESVPPPAVIEPAPAPAAEAPPQPEPASPAAGSGRAASPAARVRARELGVDLSGVTGSGPGGAITLADVEGAGGKPPSVPPTRKAGFSTDEMRKAIAAAMARSKQTIPHFYVSETIDIQTATDWLASRNAESPPSERLLLGALFVRAVALAASRVPVTNGTCVDGVHQPQDTVNVGVAIALRGGGLVAPAVVGAEGLRLEEIMSGMRDLVSRARAGRLRSSEMTAGTITVSSLGEGGAEAMSGVIFPPQVALVGIGSPRTRPRVVGDGISPRTVVNVTLSVDHRVCDGRQAAAFLQHFATLLSAPETL
jgi:pyruvate dehydrogenase E2 component (dihydrolipoamide acetyltransferase)